MRSDHRRFLTVRGPPSTDGVRRLRFVIDKPIFVLMLSGREKISQGVKDRNFYFRLRRTGGASGRVLPPERAQDLADPHSTFLCRRATTWIGPISSRTKPSRTTLGIRITPSTPPPWAENPPLSHPRLLGRPFYAPASPAERAGGGGERRAGRGAGRGRWGGTFPHQCQNRTDGAAVRNECDDLLV